MISQTMQDALNEHMNHEIYSSYLYFSMAASFDQLNLTGMSHWMKIQAQEELFHALKIYDFLHERGGRVVLGSVAQPPGEWDSPLATFEAALAHEKEVSARVDGLVDVAEKERDRASKIFLEWFVSEQVEEESTVDGIIQHLKLVENAPQGLFLIDRELAQRPGSTPSAPADA